MHMQDHVQIKKKKIPRLKKYYHHIKQTVVKMQYAFVNAVYF